MVTIQTTSTFLFVTGLVHFVSSYPPTYDYGHIPIQGFIHRLQQHVTALSFPMSVFVLQDLEGTSVEFRECCLGYESQYGNPATALEKAINYLGNVKTLQEIENGDPVGFNVYLKRRNVDMEDFDFMNRANTFVSTMRSRIRLQKLKDELIDLPKMVRDQLGTEYDGLETETINYFIKLAAKESKKKMYAIDCVVLDEFDTYKNNRVDDVQIFGATYYNFGGASQVNLHALCINYKASTGMVHVYDSGNPRYLEGRQKAIIQKLYPDRDIEFEESTALQGGNTTCAIFAITYATMLLNGKDPKRDPIKLNEVFGDETLHMRLDILDMLSKRKLFLPN